MCRPHLRPAARLLLVALLAGCAAANPQAIRAIALPDAPPVRTVTSFTEALHCLDGLLLAAGRAPVVLSSSEVTDFTRQIAVSGDDMLVNAISQINRRSGAYVFLDQARTRRDGMVDLVIAVPGREPRPQYYIRGAISQLDGNVLNTGLDFSGEEQTPSRDASLLASNGTAIVSVDMHLVAYPSRRVVPGASVANSMVVTNRSLGGGFSGMIDMSLLGLRLRVARVESLGQAVRSLIELGVIELLGRHSGVPYERCLLPALGATDGAAPGVAAATPGTLAVGATAGEGAAAPVSGAATHRQDARSDEVQALQAALILLGHFDPPTTGTMDSRTRTALQAFQRQEAILPTGRLDGETRRRLAWRLAREPSSASPDSSSTAGP
jgi:hypothetical protein